MTNAWKMRGGIPSEGSNDKAADELAFANLQNKRGGGFQGNCHNCDKKGHTSEDCRAPKKDEDNTTGTQGGRNKTHCNHCHCDRHTEIQCFRKPGNPGYKELKPKGGNKASNIEIFLTEVETGAEEFVEPVEPIKLCLV